MRAPVRRRDNVTGGIPVDDDVLAEQGPGNGLPVDFLFRCHGIPVVTQGRIIVEDCHSHYIPVIKITV